MSFLLLDWHDIPQRLLELAEMQVEILLIRSEPVDILGEDRNVTLLVIFYNWKRSTIRS